MQQIFLQMQKYIIFSLPEVISSLFPHITPYFEPTISCTTQRAITVPNHSTWKTAIWELWLLEIFDNPKSLVFQYGTPYFDDSFGFELIKSTYPPNIRHFHAADFFANAKIHHFWPSRGDIFSFSIYNALFWAYYQLHFTEGYNCGQS